jgi:hypothetical protein
VARELTEVDLAQRKTGPTPEEIQKDEEMERAIAGLLSN